MKPGVTVGFHTAEGTLILKSLLEIYACGCVDRSEEDLKHIDEEEERQAQRVGEDEGPEPVPAGVNCWCRCMHCSAAETEIGSQSCSELQWCRFLPAPLQFFFSFSFLFINCKFLVMKIT